jgi:hypothetical protein
MRDVGNFTGESNILRDSLFPPPHVIRGRVGVGVGSRDDTFRASDPNPLVKDPHLNPPPEYMGRRAERAAGSLAAAPTGLHRMFIFTVKLP